MSKKISFRGDENKEKLLRSCEILCVGHYVLVFGEKKNCQCGEEITSDYFIFSCLPKSENEEQFTIIAGPNCGKKLIALGNLFMPPIINPLLGDLSVFDSIEPISYGLKQEANKSDSTVLSSESKESINRMTQLNREVSYVIFILAVLWKKEPTGKIQSARELIARNPDRNIPFTFLDSINKAAIKTIENKKSTAKTLRECFEKEAERNKVKVRHLEIPNIQKLFDKNDYSSVL